MIGEIMCHLTGFLAPIPYDIIFIVIGLIWFLAGWIISSRRQNQRWLKALNQIGESERKKIIQNAYPRRKRKSTAQTVKKLH